MSNRPAIFYNAGRPATAANFIGEATVTGDVLLDLEFQEDEDIPALPLLHSLVLTTGTLFNTPWLGVSWSQGSDSRISEYEVQVERGTEGVVMAFRTDGTSARIEPVVAGILYTVSIWNILTSGRRNQTLEDSIVVATDDTIPGVPADVIMGVGLRNITAGWTDNSDIDVAKGVGRYHVELADAATFNPGDIVHDEFISGTVISIGDLLPDTEYWLRVAAQDTSGNESATSTAISATTPQIGVTDIGIDVVNGTHIIADAIIGTTHIQDATIANAHIITLEAGKLTTDTLNATTITLGQNVKATGTVTLTGGGSGNVSSIKVNAVETMSGTENFTTNLTITATNIAANITAHTSSPEYTAESSGTVITITHDAGGTVANGWDVTSISATITTDDVNMSGGTDNKSVLKSDTYVAGVSGFLINGDGDAELNSATIRGSLVAGTISIGVTNLFNVDTAGNVWWGTSSTFASATNKISNTGNVTLNNGTFKGNITGATGTFTGSITGASGTFTGGLTGATGAFAGTVLAANITAGLINGSTLRTAAAAHIKINGTDIGFFSASSTQRAKISYAGGNFTIDAATFSAANLIMKADIVTIQSAAGGNLTCDSNNDLVLRVAAGKDITMDLGTDSIVFFESAGKCSFTLSDPINGTGNAVNSNTSFGFIQIDLSTERRKANIERDISPYLPVDTIDNITPILFERSEVAGEGYPEIGLSAENMFAASLWLGLMEFDPDVPKEDWVLGETMVPGNYSHNALEALQVIVAKDSRHRIAKLEARLTALEVGN